MKIKSSEDHLAIWLGALVLLAGLAVFVLGRVGDLSSDIHTIKAQMAREQQRAPFKTVEWHALDGAKAEAMHRSTEVGKWLTQLTSRPRTWSANPLNAFISTGKPAKDTQLSVERDLTEAQNMVQDLKAEALVAQSIAQEQNFENPQANKQAMAAVSSWEKARESVHARASDTVKPYNIVGNLFLLGLILGLLFACGAYFMGIPFFTFLKGFWVVFALGLLAYVLASQSDMKNIGFGYAAWAILIGLVISNTTGFPEWIRPALRTEYYIKTGLVLLGAEILFGKILTIGLPGLFVAWVVTPIVLVSTFWFGQRILRITSKTLNITISADMSVCGVSAAIATAAACQAKKEELTLAIGLSMVFTSVMMIVLPAVIKAMGLPDVLGGAWIGGTIDATGAVVAAGAFLGDRALNVAATIKMIQNILIGIVAFAVAVYWTARVDKSVDAQVGWLEIWRRFPKFILGFIGASVVFTALYFVLGKDMGDALIDQGVIRSFSKNMRGWLFCLAFVSIGLSTNFSVLREHFKGGKPLILYLSGQAFNLLLTLLMAYLMFYIVFPDITERI